MALFIAAPEDAALYPIQSESDISLTDPKIAGLGNNPMLFAELANVETIGWLETPFPSLGGVVLARVATQVTLCSLSLHQKWK